MLVLLGGNFLWDNYPGGNCLGGNYLWGNRPGGNCPAPIYSTHQVRCYHFFIFEVIVESVNLITDVKIE